MGHALGVRYVTRRSIDTRAYVSVFCSEAVLVGLWFGAHGSALRFLGDLLCVNPSSRPVLLFGVMHLFYAVWDYLEDAVTSKPNPSDSQLLMHTVGLPMEGESAAPCVKMRYIASAHTSMVRSPVHLRVARVHGRHHRRHRRLQGEYRGPCSMAS